MTMRLNDMTLADIDAFAEKKSQEYVPQVRRAAKSAIVEGACWAYEYLTKEGGNEPAWCVQEKDQLITAGLLVKNGWMSNPACDHFLIKFEVNGIPIYFEYNMVNKTLFYCDGLIPYPVERLSQIKDVFNVLRVEVKWEV